MSNRQLSTIAKDLIAIDNILDTPDKHCKFALHYEEKVCLRGANHKHFNSHEDNYRFRELDNVLLEAAKELYSFEDIPETAVNTLSRLNNVEHKSWYNWDINAHVVVNNFVGYEGAKKIIRHALQKELNNG